MNLTVNIYIKTVLTYGFVSFLFLNSKIDQIMNVHHDNYNTFTKLQMDNKQNDNTTTLPSAPVSSIRVSALVSTDDLSLVELVE